MRAPFIAVTCLSAIVLAMAGCGWGRNTPNLGNYPGVPLGQPAPTPTLSQRIGTAFRKAGEALTPKPRVTPAPDPTRLGTKPKQVSAEVYTQAARLCEAKGDIPSAIAQYQKALDVDPNDLKALLGLARLYDSHEDFTKATETYARALEAHPGNGVVLNHLGLCYARQRDVPHAIECLSRAVEADPSNKLYRNNLATIYADNGQPALALQQFAAVHGEPVAYYNVGLLLYKKGDHAAAVSCLQRAVQLDPSLRQAHMLLARLQPRGRQAEGAQPAQAAGYSASVPQRQPAIAQRPPENYAPVVSPADLRQGGASPSAGSTAPQFAEVRVPEMGQYAPGGDAQTPPTPDQYGSAFQPTAFPRPLPPVE